MSGSLIQLAAKGAQDAYITNSAGMSLFRTKYTRHKNFSQAAKLIKIITNKDSTVIIPSYGDLLDGLWFEGDGSRHQIYWVYVSSIHRGNEGGFPTI